MLKYALHWTPVFNTYIYLRLCHPSDLSSEFPTKMLHIDVTSHFSKRASYPAIPILFQLNIPKHFLKGTDYEVPQYANVYVHLFLSHW